MRPRQPGPAQEILPDGTPIRDFNSLLLKHMPMWFSKRKDASNQSVMHAPWARTVSRLMFLRRDASWRRMLLAQPPFTVFEGVQQWHVYGADSLAVGCLEFPDGVRMGLAYDIAVASVEGPSVKSIPVSFYTLMDGRTSYYVRGQKAKNDWEMPERIFGGIDKFTLVTRSDGGRLQLDHETRRKIELQHREYTSVGSELAKIVLRKVPRVVKYPGSLYAWWTDDGYIKANE